MVQAALNGELDGVPTETDPVFGLIMPISCPNVPAATLNPRQTWADKTAYDTQAHKLLDMFAENFTAFAGQVPVEVRATGRR